MTTAVRGVRVDPDQWQAVSDRLAALAGPVTVTVTIRPGDDRNGAVRAFLRTLLDETEPSPTEEEA